MSDSISNFITALKNAAEAKKESVTIPYSSFLFNVALALEKEGYLKGVSKKGKRVNKFIEAKLAYVGKEPVIADVKRKSKLSKRIYKKSTDLYPIRDGLGRAFLSTTKGVITERTARKEKVGGELLFEIW